MNKKAQGALEFLMTYGWAFLVILIMIGALAYFGVLNPTRFLPERCSFGTQLGCEDYILDGEAGSVKLKIRNNLAYTINISAIEVTDPDNQFTCATGAATDDGTGIVQIESGSTGDLETQTTCTGSIPTGSKYKVYPMITYYDVRSGEAFAHDITGELFAEVQNT